MTRTSDHTIPRYLRTAAFSASAAECGLFLLLWLLSLFTAAVLSWDVRGFTFVAHSQRNLIGVRLYQDDQGSDEGFHVGLYPNPDYVQTSGLWDELRLETKRVWPTLGIGHARNYTDRQYGWAAGNRPIDSVYAPHWLIVLLSAISPAVWLLRVRRGRARARAGHCVRCGYDLRATPRRCPECGWTARAAARAAAA